jgi:hypothetical protein
MRDRLSHKPYSNEPETKEEIEDYNKKKAEGESSQAPLTYVICLARDLLPPLGQISWEIQGFLKAGTMHSSPQ